MSRAEREREKMASFLNQAKVYEKHESKFLNSALILYLCFGAFLFNNLSEFNDIELDSNNNNIRGIGVTSNDIQQNDQYSNKTNELITAEKLGSNRRKTTSTTTNKPTKDLNELRLTSVRRMWNITNRLNILYESNWTLLVLDELVEFERRLLEKLSSREIEIGNGIEQVGDGDRDRDEYEEIGLDVEVEIDTEGEKESGKSSKSTDKKATSSGGDKSSRSIKKSFFHSLATITTIGK